MAKLYFYYSSMNAGKSTALLQSSYNYRERGMNTIVLAPELDDRYGAGQVTSRIGLEAPAQTFDRTENLLRLVAVQAEAQDIHCVGIPDRNWRQRSLCFAMPPPLQGQLLR